MAQAVEQENVLVTGKVPQTLVKFAGPYLLACFLQTLYGMVDLYVVGRFNDAATTSAVSIGSQVMHMLTVMIIGLAMGATVQIGHAFGGGDKRKASKITGISTLFFIALSFVAMVLLLLLTNPIVSVMMTPEEAVDETIAYLRICFIGIPFIMGYNVIAGIFRGAGDSVRPMYFAGVACLVNVVLDFALVGGLHMGATGAALATVFGQAVSVLTALLYSRRNTVGFRLYKEDFTPKTAETSALKGVLKVGFPISMQDGFIQIAFIVITIIANSRGLIDSAGVGIVEKMISFLFLVPSAFLSAISAMTAQNMGADKPERARKALFVGIGITFTYGLLVFLMAQLWAAPLVGLFTKDAAVKLAGAAYFRSYSLDTAFAAIHFCFSGYFAGIGKSNYSFIHNLISVVAVRVPGSYFASVLYPATLLPMGLAAPAGSLLSCFICLGFYLHYQKKYQSQPAQVA